MVFAPGGGRGQLPKPVAAIFVVMGPLFIWFAIKSAREAPVPRILSCTRERADAIVCQPGDARGAQAIVRYQTGKNAKACFTLGQTWICGGDVNGAAAKVNALPVGATTEADLTVPKSPSVIVAVLLLAVIMFGIGAHRLLKKAH